MAWWILLVPALAGILSALPYLIGAQIGGSILATILTNPSGLLAIFAGAIGVWLAFKGKTKEGLIAIIIGAAIFLAPQFFAWSINFFGNVYLMFSLMGLLLIYYLGSTKQLTGKTIMYVFAGLIIGLVAFILVPIASGASAGNPTGGGVAPPVVTWWNVNMQVTLGRSLGGTAKVEEMLILDKSKVESCIETFPTLSAWPAPGDEYFIVKIVTEKNMFVAQKRFKVHFGWGAWKARKSFNVCLRDGTYVIKVWAEDTPEEVTSTTIHLGE